MIQYDTLLQHVRKFCLLQVYMLETVEAAEAGYKKREKKPAPQGVASFNAKTLYEAYERRTANIPTTPEEYEKMKQTMPEFYRAADSMLYGVRTSFRSLCCSMVFHSPGWPALSCKALTRVL